MEISVEHLRTYVVDRFEGRYAILEDSSGRLYDVLRNELPEDLREGDVLHSDNGQFTIDKEATEKERAKIKKIFDNLVEKY